jgi:pimeloyl-ACP methyl ester carboxylesterase
LAPPDPEPVADLLRSWIRRAARSAGRAVRGGRMVTRRPGISNWQGQHLAYDWFYPRVTTPVHLYAADESVADMDSDPSLGLSPHLVGGFTTTAFEGCGHWTCLQDPVADRLAAAIDRDRRLALDPRPVPG